MYVCPLDKSPARNLPYAKGGSNSQQGCWNHPVPTALLAFGVYRAALPFTQHHKKASTTLIQSCQLGVSN